MALPYVFANVTELDTPQLDANFNALGALTTIPCTASGTNTIALVPISNTPTIASYTSRSPVFAFVASATTTTSPVTINVSGVGAKNVYKSNGLTLIGANDFVNTGIYYVAYDSTLNSGAGGFLILNPGATSASAGAVQSAFKNLLITNTTATSAAQTKVIITADSVAVSDGSSNFNTLFTVSVTINSATSGANGIDTGSIANSTWYAVYVIYNPSTLTTAGLISTNFSLPTSLPSGYSQYARVGSVRTDASAHFINFIQKGRWVQYAIGVYNGATLAVPPLMDQGVKGTYSATSPVAAAISLANFVPTTASRIQLDVTNDYKLNGGANVLVSPNTNYFGTNNGPFGSNGIVWPFFMGSSVAQIASVTFEIETTSIFWCADSTGGAISTLGYEDNI